MINDVLPMVLKYNTPVVALATDSAGIPSQPEARLEVLKKIVARAESMGITRDRIVADCLAESAGINPKAAETTIRTMRLVKEELGLNLCMGASNISLGLPVRSYINTVFMALVVNAGLDSAIVNIGTVRPYVLAADLVSGRDPESLAGIQPIAEASRRLRTTGRPKAIRKRKAASQARPARAGFASRPTFRIVSLI